MMEISEPLTLAKLPQPQTENGRIFYAQVYGLNNGLKRKRQELCAAIDGDSINIYEVRQGRILSSCPIPPDSVLSCSPCSLYWKNQTGTKVRSTYYVISKRNEINLSLYQEELDGTNPNPLSTGVVLDSSSTPVVQLEVLPGLDAHSVLVLRENGQYEVFKMNLSAQIGRGVFQGTMENSQLVAARSFSSMQASKSVLKARPDLIAVSGADCSFVLGVFATSNGLSSGGAQEIEIGVWKVQDYRSSSLSESHLTPILHHKTAISSPLLGREKRPVDFALKDTRLIIRTQSKVSVFDLTLVTPRKIQELPQVSSDQRSSIFISDTLTSFSISSTVQLYNTQFRTYLNKLDLNKTGVKRKRSNVPGGPVTLVAYFPGLQRILATRRDQLIAVDLQVSAGEDFSAATKQVALLVNNLGRGTTSQDRLSISERVSESSVGRLISYRDQLEQSRDTVKDLDQLIQKKEWENFEKLALENLTAKVKKASTESQMSKNYKVDYIISKILEYQTTPDEHPKIAIRSLKLAIPAQKLLETLAVKGYLSIERINRILRPIVKFNFEPIKHGVISQVLVDNDQSLGLLHKYFDEAPHIAYQELCMAVQLLLRRALVDSTASTTLALTGVPSGSPTDNHISSAAPNSMDSKGVIAVNVSTCLCAAVERLADTSQKTLSRFMQRSFSQGEIIALIQFIRQQLFRSGYTRSVQAQLHPDLSTSEENPSLHHGISSDKSTGVSIGAIASILSSCMDAVGPMGVLSFGDEEAFVQTLIPELSSEISRATEAIQDAAFLGGLLRETLRYVESTARSQPQNAFAEGSLNNTQPKPGTILTLYSEPTTEGSFDQIDGALPLGLRNEGKINATKTRKGNGKRIKRSEREMGMQQDRLRGPYALERLVF